MFYKFLTKDEIDNLKRIKYEVTNRALYEMEVSKYLDEINYDKRLQEYLESKKDKWYMKLKGRFLKKGI